MLVNPCEDMIRKGLSPGFLKNSLLSVSFGLKEKQAGQRGKSADRSSRRKTFFHLTKVVELMSQLYHVKARKSA